MSLLSCKLDLNWVTSTIISLRLEVAYAGIRGSPFLVHVEDGVTQGNLLPAYSLKAKASQLLGSKYTKPTHS